MVDNEEVFEQEVRETCQHSGLVAFLEQAATVLLNSRVGVLGDQKLDSVTHCI